MRMSCRPYSKGPYILIRPLDPAKNFPEAVFLGVAMEWLLDDEDVWLVELEYRLKRLSLLIGPFDRDQNFTGVSSGCLHWVSYAMATQ